MKGKRIAGLLLTLIMLFYLNGIPACAVDFSEGLPEGWTQSCIGNASVTAEGGVLITQVTGTKTTAASAEVITAPENTGSSIYLKLNFSVNNAAVDRELYLTDGNESIRLAVINGLTLTTEYGGSAELTEGFDYSLEIGMDCEKALFTVYLDNELLYGGALSEEERETVNKLDFSCLSVRFYMAIILQKASSVFRLNELELAGLEPAEPVTEPPVDKAVLTEAEAECFKVDYGTRVDMSGAETELFDETEQITAEHSIQSGQTGLAVTPDSPLECGHTYTLRITGVQDFHHQESYETLFGFMVAEEGYEPPAAELLSPADGEEFFTGEPVLISARGESSVFSELAVYVDDSLIQSADEKELTAEYTFSEPGEHRITVRVSDSYGGYSQTGITVNVRENHPPELRLLSPQEGQLYAVGDTIKAEAEAQDAEGLVDRVEFYYDGTLMKTCTAEPYTFTLTVNEPGGHSITAAAYDDRGLKSEASALISAEKTEKVYIFTNDFDSYSGVNAPENMGGVSTVNGGSYESGLNTDNGTSCFKMALGEVMSGGGPFVMLKAGVGGKIGAEADIYFHTEGSAGVSFTLRNSAVTVGDVSFSGQSLRLKNGSETTNIKYTNGEWHHFKYEFDTYRNTYDFYWDYEPACLGYKCSSDTMIDTLDHLRMTFSGKNSYVMLDNVEYYKILETPYISGAGYETADGGSVITDELPYDAQTIYIFANTKLDAETVSAETVSLTDANGAECALESVQLSDNGMYIIVKTANRLPSVSAYRVKLSGSVSSANGVFAGADAYYNFYVSAKPFDVLSCELYANGQEITNAVLKKGDRVRALVNVCDSGGTGKNALVILAFRKDGRTAALSSFSYALAAGENMLETEYVSCPEEGAELNVYVWDSWQTREPVTYKIFK